MDSPVRPTCSHATDPLAGTVWRKSSYSGTQANCVEVASNLAGLVAVRDSKGPDGTVLVVSSEEWQLFITALRKVQFNL
jgi:hypothetical protein